MRPDCPKLSKFIPSPMFIVCLQAKQKTTANSFIHLVDAQYDHGQTVATEIVPIDAADDISSLEIRVMEAECVLFVETIRRIIAGQLPLPF
ncbi:hypothetical protein GR247_04720 [Rhizobium leguminosarum]|nr:hypothetical protein [Rhizobium leguminosarum]NKK54733.1 hypothetical protein [Rhizobium leguminosarum bv. viciae]TAY84018.1 hypothetical protein ELH85_35950 [Rhizobium ruizarguesonis]TBA33505.1 hypothetical protein ELH62_30880 [Rhizobium ruizarguesonis]TBB59774.1 hypothetical protein ELH42_28410 [Rhizobium ruizarguesonis]